MNGLFWIISENTALAHWSFDSRSRISLVIDARVSITAYFLLLSIADSIVEIINPCELEIRQPQKQKT